MVEDQRFTYQSRLVYENILAEAVKRCLKERVDNPESLYPRSVKALSMALPNRIKNVFKKYEKKDLVSFIDILEIKHKNNEITHSMVETLKNDNIFEFLLKNMEKYNLLIPEKTLRVGGGYR